MKYIIYLLCVIAIVVINIALNDISQGNILGIGLGDYIFQCIGYVCVCNVLNKYILND